MGKHGAQAREKNPNWKGGRSVASNGYVLIKVGFDHHLADVRGYAYEHRLVAEKKLGRRLRPGEIPHHIDGVKTNNAPENIEVVASHAHHRAQHRTRDRGLRGPDDPNPVIACACGCGAMFTRFDATNRPRRYVPGHNPPPAPTLRSILAALGDGPVPRSVIVSRTHLGMAAVAGALSKLKRRGLVINKRHGEWRLTDGR